MTSELQSLKDKAISLAGKSPDPYMKVCCIGLDAAGTMLGYGVNHAGKVIMKDFWKDREARRPFVIHAELDMLANCRNLPVRTIVITLLPCVNCMNALAAFGIKVVYYMDWYTKDIEAFNVAKHHGIECKRI